MHSDKRVVAALGGPRHKNIPFLQFEMNKSTQVLTGVT